MYEILLIYKENFKYPIKQNLDFFKKFIRYIIEKKDEKKVEKKDAKKDEKKKSDDLEKGLSYIKDLETFLDVVEEKKEDIHKKYNSKKIEKIIKIDQLKFTKIDIVNEQNKGFPLGSKIFLNSPETEKKDTEENNSLEVKTREMEKRRKEELINKIDSLIKFCRDENTFLVHFTENFWKYVLNYYNEAKQENIKTCFELRETFKKYYDLVEKIFKKIEKKDKHYSIYKEAKNYYDRDELAFLLDQIIRKCNKDPEV